MAQGKSNNNIIYYATTLQNAAAATGNGTAVNCKGIGSLGIQINGTFSGTVVFEATVDDSNWIAIEGTNLNTSAKATSATAAGILRFDTSQLSQFRARISVYASGSITVKGLSSELPMGGAPEASTVASVQGQAADDAAKSGNPVQVGGIYSTTPATRANGDMVAWEMTATGAGTVSLTGSYVTRTALGNTAVAAGSTVDVFTVTNADATLYKEVALSVLNPTGVSGFEMYMTDEVYDGQDSLAYYVAAVQLDAGAQNNATSNIRLSAKQAIKSRGYKLSIKNTTVADMPTLRPTMYQFK